MAAVLLVAQSSVMAQKAKVVKEQDVPSQYVTDLQRVAPKAEDVTWTMLDSLVYDATFLGNNNNKTSVRLKRTGVETRTFVPSAYYPRAIRDTVERHYPKFKITDLCVVEARGKRTYEARIAKRGGLFRREKAVRYLNFEISYKFIDEVEQPF